MNSYDQIKLCENKIMDSCKSKSWEYYNSRESQRTIKKRQNLILIDVIER